MRSIYKNILFPLIAFVMVGTFTSCSEDDLPNDGKPIISYVRVTDPDASDSLVVSAGQGSMIAIVGYNLQNAKELWLNDRQASLTPTYITNTSIITRVPSRIPLEINNVMKLIFSNGDSLLYDFEVAISKPLLTRLVSEYVNDGDVAKIRGDYFYEPLTVIFSGGAIAEIAKIEDDFIEVIVPEDAEPGPITVTTNFGETISDFWFRDNRNIIATFEGSEADGDFAGWWSFDKGYIKSSDPVIVPISDNFIRVDEEKGPWSWTEFWVGDGGTIAEATKKIPEEAFVNPKGYSLKFEINTLAPLTGAEARLYMGNSADFGGDRQNIYYIWKPNIDTKGEWETVNIPFENFLGENTNLQYNTNGYQVSFYFSSPITTTLNFALDNIRVVPNK